MEPSDYLKFLSFAFIISTIAVRKETVTLFLGLCAFLLMIGALTVRAIEATNIKYKSERL